MVLERFDYTVSVLLEGGDLHDAFHGLGQSPREYRETADR
jgi:hypothetical protein